jgi:hypothetical protein
MKNVDPREYRIRQLAPARFQAEEGRRWGFFGRTVWQTVNWRGELGYDSGQATVHAARDAIRLRKEGLLRADEFPILIEQYTWDGVAPDLRMVG